MFRNAQIHRQAVQLVRVRLGGGGGHAHDQSHGGYALDTQALHGAQQVGLAFLRAQHRNGRDDVSLFAGRNLQVAPDVQGRVQLVSRPEEFVACPFAHDADPIFTHQPRGQQFLLANVAGRDDVVAADVPFQPPARRGAHRLGEMTGSDNRAQVAAERGGFAVGAAMAVDDLDVQGLDGAAQRQDGQRRICRLEVDVHGCQVALARRVADGAARGRRDGHVVAVVLQPACLLQGAEFQSAQAGFSQRMQYAHDAPIH
ncbi:hypothetical protein D3C71_1299560 [compost metagenome]